MSGPAIRHFLDLIDIPPRELRGMIEASRAMREMAEVKGRGELVERGDGPHGIGRADQHGESSDGQSLDAIVAQRGDRQSAGAF